MLTKKIFHTSTEGSPRTAPPAFIRVWLEALNFLFPLRCQSCRAYLDAYPIAHLCTQCETELYQNITPVCSICCKSTDDSAQTPFVCKSCRNKRTPDLIFLHAGLYKDSLKALICMMKYGHKEFLTQTLGEYLLAFITRQQLEMNSYAYIIPVPLSRKRMRERGFNQANKIAQPLSHYTGIPIGADILYRKNHAHNQADLDRTARLTNLSNVFYVKRNSDLKGTSIILIDDVRSTGSTLYFCAEALFAEGVKSIMALTLAFNE